MKLEIDIVLMSNKYSSDISITKTLAKLFNYDMIEVEYLLEL